MCSPLFKAGGISVCFTFGSQHAHNCFLFFVEYFYCLLFPIEKRNSPPSYNPRVFQLLVLSECFLESIPVSVLEILFLEPTASSSNLDWVLLRPTHSRLSGSSSDSWKPPILFLPPTASLLGFTLVWLAQTIRMSGNRP